MQLIAFADFLSRSLYRSNPFRLCRWPQHLFCRSEKFFCLLLKQKESMWNLIHRLMCFAGIFCASYGYMLLCKRIFMLRTVELLASPVVSLTCTFASLFCGFKCTEH